MMSDQDHAALLDQLQAQVNLVVCMLPFRSPACINIRTARADRQGVRRDQYEPKGCADRTSHEAAEHAPCCITTLPSSFGSTGE